jgi:hypothetical protein
LTFAWRRAAGNLAEGGFRHRNLAVTPPDYVGSEGARFEVRFTKSRGFWGADAEPFEARFVDGAWSTSEIVADDSDAALAALRADGLSIRQIAERSGRSKSAVDRRLKGGAS